MYENLKKNCSQECTLYTGDTHEAFLYQALGKCHVNENWKSLLILIKSNCFNVSSIPSKNNLNFDWLPSSQYINVFLYHLSVLNLREQTFKSEKFNGTYFNL